MRIKDEFEIRECFELEPGCPTLTVSTPFRETMLPWSSFTSGEWVRDKVILEFGQQGAVQIVGQNLREIWRAAQMQELRLIRPSRDTDNGNCRIESLSNVAFELEDDIPF
ncbi:hypothetical protein [Roseibacillus persicicus]|uniref:Uncharacterized protein n=1 Tax=Roseibacillus persicicus TaxID=454148 RepID=A0A918WL13_9BACT|nr:hypothetical protein [Roseibacillus persicicus]GHC56062.1 hypothetical protein GCM10007100_23690 [Roseibacillus persicicus]